MGTKRAAPPTGFKTLRRTSPTSHVRDELRAAIENGDYPPGSMLPSERVLCESFGVSRVSVREALAGLESTGLIRVEHGRGAIVRESVSDSYAGPFGRYLELHRAELVELLKVRGALDELAATEATEHADEAGLAHLLRAEGAFADAAGSEAPNYAQIAELDIAFHMGIAESSQGILLPRLVGQLSDVLSESRRITLARPGQLERSVSEHRAIAQAIVDRDAAKARRAVRKHLVHIRKWVDDFTVPDE